MPCIYIHRKWHVETGEAQRAGQDVEDYICLLLPACSHTLHVHLFDLKWWRGRGGGREKLTGVFAHCSHNGASKSKAKELFLAAHFSWLYLCNADILLFCLFVCRGSKTDGDMLCLKRTVCCPSPRSPSCCCASAFCSLWSQEKSTCMAAQTASTGLRLSRQKEHFPVTMHHLGPLRRWISGYVDLIF